MPGYVINKSIGMVLTFILMLDARTRPPVTIEGQSRHYYSETNGWVDGWLGGCSADSSIHAAFNNPAHQSGGAPCSARLRPDTLQFAGFSGNRKIRQLSKARKPRGTPRLNPDTLNSWPDGNRILRSPSEFGFNFQLPALRVRQPMHIRCCALFVCTLKCVISFVFISILESIFLTTLHATFTDLTVMIIVSVTEVSGIAKYDWFAYLTCIDRKLANKIP